MIADGTAAPQVFCGRCGRPEGSPDDVSHEVCRELSELEPPRYCHSCGRRMVVQVNPVGWTARCVRHGEQHG